jgi:hypothetical protein
VGGRSSGRQRTRPLLRDRLRLDALWVRQPSGEAEGWAELRWPNGATVGVQVHPDAVELRYQWRGGPIHQRLRTLHVACHFGGTRPLFCCPDCGRRARILYLHPSRFVCRRCTGLRYWSQSVSSRTRAQIAIHRVQKRLAPGDAFGSWPPDEVPGEKPKGMRRKTHERLLQRLEVLQDRWDYWTDYELARAGLGWLDSYSR